MLHAVVVSAKGKTLHALEVKCCHAYVSFFLEMNNTEWNGRKINMI